MEIFEAKMEPNGGILFQKRRLEIELKWHWKGIGGMEWNLGIAGELPVTSLALILPTPHKVEIS